jgi:hypothetical protein
MKNRSNNIFSANCVLSLNTFFAMQQRISKVSGNYYGLSPYLLKICISLGLVKVAMIGKIPVATMFNESRPKVF